jgi:hypothetical protein
MEYCLRNQVNIKILYLVIREHFGVPFFILIIHSAIAFAELEE